jgi:hypothetical protein
LILLGLALAAQLQLTPAQSDARLRALAERGSLITSRMSDAVLQDPAMRAEWRRVGFEKGCLAFASAEKEVKARHLPLLVEPTIAAVRKFVPQERLDRLPALSFSYGGLQVYRARVEQELGRTSGGLIADAVEDMRRNYQAQVKALPTATNPEANVVIPKADIGAALGVKGAWDLNNPAQLGMACAELRIPPGVRPQINVGAKN